MADDARSEYMASLPEIPEGDEPDVDTDLGQEEEPLTRERDENGRFKAKEEVETPVVADAPVETPKEEETPPASTDDETAEIKAQAEYFADLKSRLEKLPEAEQIKVLASLGYIEQDQAKQMVENAEYQPVGAIEERLAPHIENILGIPQKFDSLTTELNEVLVKQSQAMDVAVAQNAWNSKILNHFAEMFQLESPQADVKSILEGVQSGKTLDVVLDEKLKDSFAKNKVRMEQARKARPEPLGTESNEVEGIGRNDDMAQILNRIRGTAPV